ncbi:MAG: winged helix-turn-helix transcriptional regulator [Betaproteobacteria bacterium]|nr:winged helix-turn-helix transcriptional regulator [Betaproteobacteria bacterium]
MATSGKKTTASKKIASTPAATARTGEDIFALIGKAQNIEEAAVAMQAMAHPMRLKILCLLGSGELAVGEIVEAVGTTQGNVSQHLSILRDRGLITSRSEGRQVFYKIEDARVLKMIALTRDIFCSI